MKEYNMTSLQEMLEQMSTQRLDEMLHAELKRKPVDDNAVRLILRVLEEREKDMPVEITPGIEAAWVKYQRDIAQIEAKAKRPRKLRGWVLQAASIAAVFFFVVMLIVPQQADAESIWEILARWTNTFFEFISPGEDRTQQEYVFQTDNSGLQQVYDAVVELGVTEPVVPMWLPEEYELVECTVETLPRKSYVLSRFVSNGHEIVLKVNISNLNTSGRYQKDENQVEQIEMYGKTYNIMRNNTQWVAAWAQENVECFITADCQEDILNKILKSIHVMEGKQ